MTDLLTFKNRDMDYAIQCIVVDDASWFKGKDVATILGYINTMQAIRTNVDEEDRKILGELRNSSLNHKAKNTIFINESGLYSLILSSRKPEAKAFKRWVTSEVLPVLRKSGTYEIIPVEQCQIEDHMFDERKLKKNNRLVLMNETDLHKHIVKYIRKYHPNALMIPGLGGLQDTEQKRIDSYNKGYMKGTPDLILFGPNNGKQGMVIEFKTPVGTGVVSESQKKILTKLHESGLKVIVSNDYLDIVKSIREYMKEEKVEEEDDDDDSDDSDE